MLSSLPIRAILCRLGSSLGSSCWASSVLLTLEELSLLSSYCPRMWCCDAFASMKLMLLSGTSSFCLSFCCRRSYSSMAESSSVPDSSSLGVSCHAEGRELSTLGLTDRSIADMASNLNLDLYVALIPSLMRSLSSYFASNPGACICALFSLTV